MKKFKQDRGTAGLTILLSIVVMLFIIGLIVMIFALMGSELQKAVGTISKSALTSVANESGLATNITNTTTVSVLTATLRDFSGMTVTALFIVNGSGTQKIVPATNYTANANGSLFMKTASGSQFVNQKVGNVSYSYYYTTDPDSQDAINDTIEGIKGTIDWFGIFIVITAMVVLILLTVIIITAIKSSGMIEGIGTQTGTNRVGTA